MNLSTCIERKEIMIHVCYGYSEGTGHYAKFVGTSMLSLFENMSTPPI